MKTVPVAALLVAVVLLAGLAGLGPSADDKQRSRRSRSTAPHGVTVKVRMEGPYTADVPLQVVCYFKYTPAGRRR